MTDGINQNIINNLQNNTNTGVGANALDGDNKLFDDFDDFLTLLTTQLQHQDPLSPLETAEFTNQLVGFANVEQQLAQTQELKGMAANLDAQNRISAVGYIGKNVEYEGSGFTLDGDTADIGYTLPNDTGRANLRIYDEDNKVVSSYQLGDIKPGEKQNFEWDGYRVAEGNQARSFRLATLPGAGSANATFEYRLPANADTATLTVRDGTGTVVATENVIVADGRNTHVWNGVGSIGGVSGQMPDGIYSYQITAQPRPGASALIGNTEVYEILPAGNYRAEIATSPASGAEEVDGNVRYFSNTRVTGVNGQGADIMLELATGKEITLADVLRART